MIRTLRNSNNRSTLYVVIFFFAVFLYIKVQQSRTDSDGPTIRKLPQKEVFVTTAKGNISYSTLNEEVFKPHGFEIVQYTVPIPKLRPLTTKTCDAVFADWLDIALKYEPPVHPPKEIPADLLPVFTLNGHALLTEYYKADNMPNPKPHVWSQIPQWMNKSPEDFISYKTTGGMAAHYSLKYMSMSLQGLSGCVIGSLDPWVEVIALQQGAKDILTVEYQKTEIVGTDKVTYIHPFEYARNWQSQSKFDFIVSYSSIEHSGLQRYGDPRDPIGDIREVQKARCMLKPGGLFFLGLPRGQDQLAYNAHRFYGRIRLAMLFEGFELLHVFRNAPEPVNLDMKDFVITNGVKTDMFVLKKL